MRIFAGIIYALIALGGTCQAQKGIVSSAPDPFVFRDPEIATGVVAAGYNVTVGRTQVSPRLVGGENTAIFIVVGQSLVGGNDNANYTATSPKAQTLNVFDGGVYQSVDPQLGCGGTGGSFTGRMADKLITAGKYARVIVIPLGAGSTTVASWAPGGIANGKMVAAIKRAMALGYTITGMLWEQGVTDDANGTSAAAYTASLNAVIASSRSAGFAGHWLIGLESSRTGGASSTAIRTGQTNAVNTGALVFAGPDGDTVSSAVGSRYDGTHFTATGSDSMATLWANAIIAHF